MTQIRTTKFENLKELLTASDDDFLVIRKTSEAKDYKIRRRNIVGSGQSISLQWSSEIVYDTPATAVASGNPSYAEFNGKLWKTLTDNNIGNLPTEGANWTEVSRSESGLAPWVAGAFTEDEVFVTGVPKAGYPKCLLRLTNPARPFDSADLVAEYAAGDWEIIGFELLDEDDMVSNSAIQGATQQSIKAYTDLNFWKTSGITNILNDVVVQTTGATVLTLKADGTTGSVLRLNNVDGGGLSDTKVDVNPLSFDASVSAFGSLYSRLTISNTGIDGQVFNASAGVKLTGTWGAVVNYIELVDTGFLVALDNGAGITKSLAIDDGIHFTQYNGAVLTAGLSVGSAIDMTIGDGVDTISFDGDLLNGFRCTGTGAFDGIKYGADYSANYTIRSLVDKGYVDATVSGASPAWGSITGTLSNQADLQAALDSKWPNAGNYNLAAVTRIFTNGFSLRVGTDDVHTFVNTNMTQMKTSKISTSQNQRYLIEMNRLNAVGIKIADNIDFIGLRYEADYSAGLDDLTVPNWGHVKRTIAGVDIAATSQVPGSGQNGYVFAFNFTNGEFELVPNSGISNTAALNEIMKTDGTNAVPSGLFSSASGDLVLGNAAAPVGETVRNVSVAGSAADIGLALSTKGFGELTVDTYRVKLRSSQNNGDANHGLLISSDITLYKALSVNTGFGILMSTSLLDMGYRTSSGTAITNGITVTSSDVKLTKGTGNILISGLPTADPVVAGAIWNDAGIVKISAG